MRSRLTELEQLKEDRVREADHKNIEDLRPFDAEVALQLAHVRAEHWLTVENDLNVETRLG